MSIIAYLRVSTDEQVESGLGLEAQQYSIENYANKINTEISMICRDEGLSGSLPLHKRHGLVKALNSLKKGDILLVAKRDRLSRDTKVLMTIEIEVEKKKAKIISAAGEGTENDDSASIFFRGILDHLAQFEKLRIGERTKEALQAKKKKGERVGYIPFGYKLSINNIHLEKCHKEQYILQYMTLLKNTERSLREIAGNLNELKIYNRNNSFWNHVSIHRILTNNKLCEETNLKEEEIIKKIKYFNKLAYKI